MGIYIKGLDMPKSDEMLCLNVFPNGKVTWHFDLKCEPIAIATDVPTPHGTLIDAGKLYEQTAEWEAQALHMCDVSAQDEEDKQEWRMWSTILTERSAFKYDVFDAPVVIEAEE